MNKHIIVAALAGLFSLGAFAQAAETAVTPAQAQTPAAADAAPVVKHKKVHHKHHHVPTMSQQASVDGDK